MHVPWAWRSGLARRVPESLANPPLRTPGHGRPAHAWSDRGQGSSAQGRRIAEERRRTSAGRMGSPRAVAWSASGPCGACQDGVHRIPGSADGISTGGIGCSGFDRRCGPQ
ncbi:hypothetical protein COCNU_scaffold051126G000040 [Cocos nucifera]|nr:hypothetical protein [Cocos nucifera]